MTERYLFSLLESKIYQGLLNTSKFSIQRFKKCKKIIQENDKDYGTRFRGKICIRV